MKEKLPKQSFLLSAGTDGKDGPTNAAGAIVDNKSFEKIKSKKINFLNRT